MSALIAIDPSSTSLGLAMYYNKNLLQTKTIKSAGSDRYVRTKNIVMNLMDYLLKHTSPEFDWNSERLIVVCEEPLLRGKANKSMERLLGQLEFMFSSRINYYSPSQVKAAMGSGSLDKLEVALAAGRMLTTEEEREHVASLITNEEWDATDAVAIGLTYFIKGEKV